jgi:hypothetical protein
MKVALILSGQFREAKYCYKGFKENILDIYNPDVFISTWTNSFNITPSGWFGLYQKDDCTLSEVMEMYNPKSIELETFDDDNYQPFKKMADNLDSKINHVTKTVNVNSMWYKRHRANLLRENFEKLNNFKYDLVISSRFDLEFLEPLSFQLEENKLSIPIGFDWSNGLCDLFAMGNSDIMSEYFDLYNLMEYYRLEKEVSETPELIMKYHVEHKNIELNRFLLKYKLRGSNIWECALT